MSKIPIPILEADSRRNVFLNGSKSAFLVKYLRRRQEGLYAGGPLIYRDLYSTMAPAYSWDPSTSVSHTHHGGVFNLEFSPDGSLLVAACERKSILVFDPLRGTMVNHINNAHNDCVNCVRFLDSRMFATCSDDNTVSLWDIRYLKNKIRQLKGHSNWVKNIEYAHDVGLLVTSGFDGSIYTWDINSYSEGDVEFKRVFHTDGLMRTKLSPDSSKMILCTTGGYLMVIHDLDLHNLSRDLQLFKPNMYRLMQLSNTPIHLGYTFNHLFSAKRNRVELISDFPSGNQAEVISSLQVHPQGWCVLSRNTSSNENSEWSCVHDIQDVPDWLSELPDQSSTGHEDGADGDAKESDSGDVFPSGSGSGAPTGSSPPDNHAGEGSSSSSSSAYNRPVVHIRFNCRHRTTVEGGEADGEGSSVASSGSGIHILQHQDRRAIDVTLRISSLEALEAVAATIASAQQRNPSAFTGSRAPVVTGTRGAATAAGRPLPRRGRSATAAAGRGPPTDPPSPDSSEDEDDNDDEEADEDSDSVHLDLRERPAYFIRTGSQTNPRTLLLLGSHGRGSSAGGGPGGGPGDPRGGGGGAERRILRNRPRLTHFVAEPNVGRGFIKELCFSTDGRLVCSPFGNGIRLLAFDSSYRELCDCVPDKPANLHVVATNISHPFVVVSTKFSPVHSLLVSGCLNGKISFYQPVLG